MLQAKKVSIWKGRYEISTGELLLATWDPSWWRAGGTLDLDGQRYQVRSNLWGTQYRMTTEDGTVVASADRVGRKRWTVEADHRQYEFQRASIWRHEEELRSEGHPVGSIKRTSIWRSDATADLPGLPLPVQVFVLAVVLTKWDQAAASGAAAGGGSNGG